MTREEILTLAQEAAHRSGHPMFVFQLHGRYYYGSQTWLEGMKNPKPHVEEIFWPDKEETRKFAQEEANKTGQSVCIFEDRITFTRLCVSEWREDMANDPTKFTEVKPSKS